MTHSSKKEFIYVALAFFTSISSLTWVQIAYNDPSTIADMPIKHLAIILSISSVFVLGQTLITWKAYLSDPKTTLNEEPKPPVEPPKP